MESTRLENGSGDDLRFFAAFQGLMPESAPPTDDPPRPDLGSAVRREVGLIPELVHLLGEAGSG